jgi:hypothetical protein
MEMGLFEALLEYGSMGLFAAFLVWQHLSMQKRFDKLVDKFQEQLAGIQDKADANEDKLRERYDKVISQYQDDKTTFRVNVAGQVTELNRKIDGLPFETVLIQVEALSMAQRNSHLLLEKGLEILKTMQEENRIKEMARKLSDKTDG